jgi:hypothetical protein
LGDEWKAPVLSEVRVRFRRKQLANDPGNCSRFFHLCYCQN